MGRRTAVSGTLTVGAGVLARDAAPPVVLSKTRHQGRVARGAGQCGTASFMTPALRHLHPLPCVRLRWLNTMSIACLRDNIGLFALRACMLVLAPVRCGVYLFERRYLRWRCAHSANRLCRHVFFTKPTWYELSVTCGCLMVSLPAFRPSGEHNASTSSSLRGKHQLQQTCSVSYLLLLCLCHYHTLPPLSLPSLLSTGWRRAGIAVLAAFRDLPHGHARHGALPSLGSPYLTHHHALSRLLSLARCFVLFSGRPFMAAALPASSVVTSPLLSALNAQPTPGRLSCFPFTFLPGVLRILVLSYEGWTGRWRQ